MREKTKNLPSFSSRTRVFDPRLTLTTYAVPSTTPRLTDAPNASSQESLKLAGPDQVPIVEQKIRLVKQRLHRHEREMHKNEKRNHGSKPPSPESKSPAPEKTAEEIAADKEAADKAAADKEARKAAKKLEAEEAARAALASKPEPRSGRKTSRR